MVERRWNRFLFTLSHNFFHQSTLRVIINVIACNQQFRQHHSRTFQQKFDNFRLMLDKIDAVIAENVKDAEQAEEFNETTRKFRELIDGLEEIIRG